MPERVLSAMITNILETGASSRDFCSFAARAMISEPINNILNRNTIAAYPSRTYVLHNVVFKRFYELPVGNSEIILCRVIISKRAGIFVLLHLRSQARYPSQILTNASSKLILDIQNYISIPDFITRNTPTTKSLPMVNAPSMEDNTLDSTVPPSSNTKSQSPSSPHSGSTSLDHLYSCILYVD